MFSSMSLFLLIVSSFIYPYLLIADQFPQPPTARITILGSVYCDVCYHNTFSKHSYFLSGVDVHVECKFKASSSPRTAEQISFSVNRTTDRYGMYKLDIPSVDCTEDPTIQSFCKATLIGTSVSVCNVPSTTSISTEMTLKSKQNNICSYTLGTLSYKPAIRNVSLCGNERLESSKFFLPPYVFPWPQLPPLPPLPSFPFPPITNPPPPAFSIGDPRTWIPNNPLLSPPPPPPPPPPPVFNFWDPRTWIPNLPPSPTNQIP